MSWASLDIQVVRSGAMLLKTLLCTLALCAPALSHFLYNPYANIYNRFSQPIHHNPFYRNPVPTYAPHITNYSPYIPTYVAPNVLDDNSLTYTTPHLEPTLNILAEVPYSIHNDFTVVPMIVVASENMNMVSNGHIMGMERDKPIMTVQTETNDVVQCTPAVKILLEVPLTIVNLRTSILFPAVVEVVHEGTKIQIRVGAVVVPVSRDVYISEETPILVHEVYAVPTKPMKVDYVNHFKDVIVRPDIQAVVVETNPQGGDTPKQNITILTFPDKEAVPVLQVDDEDSELVNRNPPNLIVAPAGIVQSTQPHVTIQEFSNSKESSVLTALREEAVKQRYRN